MPNSFVKIPNVNGPERKINTRTSPAFLLLLSILIMNCSRINEMLIKKMVINTVSKIVALLIVAYFPNSIL